MRVKIPNVCAYFGVGCTRAYDAFEKLGLKLSPESDIADTQSTSKLGGQGLHDADCFYAYADHLAERGRRHAREFTAVLPRSWILRRPHFGNHIK